MGGANIQFVHYFGQGHLEEEKSMIQFQGVSPPHFFYSGIKDWNSLPESVKNGNNKNRFKTNVKKYLMEKLKNSYQSEFIFY